MQATFKRKKKIMYEMKEQMIFLLFIVLLMGGHQECEESLKRL
jgi:hypothetical protein